MDGGTGNDSLSIDGSATNDTVLGGTGDDLLVAGDDEQEEVGVEVVLAERLAIDRRGIDQGRHEVVAVAAQALQLAWSLSSLESPLSLPV